MADYVTQCHENFPLWRGDTSSLGTKIKGFTVGLEDFSKDEIDFGFRRWLKEGKKMPLPSDIGDIIREKRRGETRLSDYPDQARPAPRQNANCVPWAGKSWNKIQAEGWMPQIEQHLVNLTKLKGKERAAEYLNYLKTGPQNRGGRI